MKPSLITIALIFSYVLFGFAQIESKKSIESQKFCYLQFFDKPILNLNIQQGWRTMGEVDFGLADYQGGIKQLGLNTLQNIELGSQFNFSPKHFIMGPELCYHVSFLLINFGASIIYFTDFTRGTLFLNPHLGFSYNTFFDIYAGYNIPFLPNKMKTLVNKFTITLAFPLFKR